MKYILAPNIALRSWHRVPYAYYVKGGNFAMGLTKEEFELLLQCNGKKDLPESGLLTDLLQRDLICPARDRETLTPWQQPLLCGNRYVPQMNFQITAKCNYNCVHCFNAADNSPLCAEMPYEDVLSLLDEARACGINAITITGGEPMMHRHFMDIMHAIYERGMFVFDFNTNGYFLRQETLGEFRAMGCEPLMKISFDGIGYHDWMRGRHGAEADALRAIRLCVENGFPVMVQYNINKKNLPSLMESLDALDAMGVREIRLIRTTPAPRWEQNAAGQTFDIGEYFDLALETAVKYAAGAHRADLSIWQAIELSPQKHVFLLKPVKETHVKYRESLPICSSVRGMIAVGATGNVYPCMQMSGWFDGHGIVLGNVKKDGLRAILTDSDYLNFSCQTVKDRITQNGKCGQCPYLKSCLGGCPALAILGSEEGDPLAPDPFKCYFYENGYYEKFVDALPGWTNLTVMK